MILSTCYFKYSKWEKHKPFGTDDANIQICYILYTVIQRCEMSVLTKIWPKQPMLTHLLLIGKSREKCLDE